MLVLKEATCAKNAQIKIEGESYPKFQLVPFWNLLR